MSYTPRLLMLAVACLMLFAAGCAKNIVPLTYTPNGDTVIPIAGAPSVCVISFSDSRTESSIGARSDGSAFTADIPVAEWVTQSLATELTRLGYVVTTASSEHMARSSGAHYIITGSVEEAWMTEQSSTSYDCKMRVAISMKRDGHSLMQQNSFNASLSRRVVPLARVPREIMEETLRDLIHTVSAALRAKITL